MEVGVKAASVDRFPVGIQEKVGARDDGNWGPCDIVKKAFEIYKGHVCLFNWIQVTAVLPFTILWLLNQHSVGILIHIFMPIPPGPPCEDPCPAPAPSGGPTPDEWQCVAIFLFLLILAFVFWVNVVGSLLYSVGSIYAGKTICFKDVVKELPCLWKGLTITGLLGDALCVIVAVTVFLLGYLLMTFSSISVLPLPLACFLTFSFSVVSFFYATTTFQMANSVTVFEQTCGFPAFCKALQLLKCKWYVAFGLALIFIIPQAVLAAIVNAATWAWAGNCARWVVFLILAFFLAVILELNVISTALFYLSIKQSNQETISLDHFSSCQFEPGYQLIASPEQVV